MAQDPSQTPADAQPDVAKFVRLHARDVYAWLGARLLDESAAEELTRQVFLRFVRTDGVRDDPSAERTWLIGIARDVLREHVGRTRRNGRSTWTDLCLALEALPADEPVVDVGRLPERLAGLSSAARQAIEMRYSSGRQPAEIGAQLKRSEAAARLLLQSARQTLQQGLSPSSPPFPPSVRT